MFGLEQVSFQLLYAVPKGPAKINEAIIMRATENNNYIGTELNIDLYYALNGSHSHSHHMKDFLLSTFVKSSYIPLSVVSDIFGSSVSVSATLHTIISYF